MSSKRAVVEAVVGLGVVTSLLAMTGCSGGHWPAREKNTVSIEGERLQLNADGDVVISQEKLSKLIKSGDAYFIGANGNTSLLSQDIQYVDPSSLEGGENTFVVRPGSLKTNILVLAKEHGFTLKSWDGFDYYVERPQVVSGDSLEAKLDIILDMYPVSFKLDMENTELSVNQAKVDH